MIRPDFRARCTADDEVIKQQVLASHSVPVIKANPPHDIPLAVVGGGISSLKQLEDLKNWPGHIWAVNQGAQWLISHGRKEGVWMFSVSPTPRIATYIEGVERAILASQCHPDVFQGLANQGAEVSKFHLFDGCGPASICNTLMPSAIMGYREVSYFGCEGSFQKDIYFYRQEKKLDQLIVRAGGKDYVTSLDLFMTTEYMSNVMREWPDRMKDRSGGLLTAMIQDPLWGVVAWSEALRDRFAPECTEKYAPA